MAFQVKQPKVKKEKESYKVEPKSEYDEQADKFLSETGTKFKIKYLKHDKYFPDDKEERDIYRFTLDKDGKKYSGTFGQSIANSDYGNTPPRLYDVLASMTKSDVGSFEEFTDDYGYPSEDKKKNMKIYKAVKKEQEGLNKLYSSEELDKLRDIN